MIKIIFESHKTSIDNESGLASGWRNSPLSEKGIEQGKVDELRYKNTHIDYIFVSDLDRAVETAKLIFPNNNIPLFIDWRLREYNYGDMEGGNKKDVMIVLNQHLDKPFPNGESVNGALERMKSFLSDLRKFDNKTILIIGHRATQMGLENIINKIEPNTYISEPWIWQPGWEYELK